MLQVLIPVGVKGERGRAILSACSSFRLLVALLQAIGLELQHMRDHKHVYKKQRLGRHPHYSESRTGNRGGGAAGSPGSTGAAVKGTSKRLLSFGGGVDEDPQG